MDTVLHLQLYVLISDVLGNIPQMIVSKILYFHPKQMWGLLQTTTLPYLRFPAETGRFPCYLVINEGSDI